MVMFTIITSAWLPTSKSSLYTIFFAQNKSVLLACLVSFLLYAQMVNIQRGKLQRDGSLELSRNISEETEYFLLDDDTLFYAMQM